MWSIAGREASLPLWRSPSQNEDGILMSIAVTGTTASRRPQPSIPERRGCSGVGTFVALSVLFYSVVLPLRHFPAHVDHQCWLNEDLLDIIMASSGRSQLKHP